MPISITKSSLLQLPHLQRSHKWDLEIIRRPIIPNFIAEDLLRSVTVSAEVPKWESETAEFNKQGLKWKETVNVNTNGEWKFTAYELETSPLRNLAIAWKQSLKNGTLSRRDGTADFKLTSKTATGQANHVYIIKYWYPIEIDVPELNSEPGFYQISFSGEFMDSDIRRV